MRNYIRLRCIRILNRIPPAPFDPTEFYVAFGGDDDDMLFHINFLKTFILSSSPTTEFLVQQPSVIWFELNQVNLSKLVNVAAGFVWSQTHLNDLFGPDAGAQTLYDMTRVEEEGSPRRTWSHGH